MLRAAENTRWERTDVPGTHRDLRDNVFVPVCPAARVSPPMQCVAVSGDDLGVAIYHSDWLLCALSIFESGYIIHLISAPMNG